MAKKKTIIIVLILVFSNAIVSHSCFARIFKKHGIKRYYKENKVELNEMFRLTKGLVSDNFIVRIRQNANRDLRLDIWFFEVNHSRRITCDLKKSTDSIKISDGGDGWSTEGAAELKRFLASDKLHKILAIFEQIRPREIELCRGNAGLIVSPHIDIPFKDIFFKPVLYFKLKEPYYYIRVVNILDANVYIARVN